jgi:zinc protease
MKTMVGFFVLLLSLSPLSAFAESSSTHEFTLNNGLTVLVRENHEAPVVSVMVWYKVGSIDEPAGETGISHVLEHMMFKGTRHLKPGQFSDLVSRFGGSENAFTSYDYTAYYQNYAANRLPLALQLEAERMHNLLIDPQQFASELKVVEEERRMRVLDKPTAYAWERFAAIARPGTGYAHPTIGWLADLNRITPEKLRRWYQDYYQPGNAYLVIVGDVDFEQAKHLVEKYFGDIKGRGEPWHASGAMLPPAGERNITLHVPVKVPTLFVAYNVPTLGNVKDRRDFYALAMLGGILDGGQSARLPTQLVRGQKLAAGVSADYSGTSRGGGLFTLSATPNPGVTLTQLQQALTIQLKRLEETPPGKAEMERVRAQVLADHVYAKDSNFGQAMALGGLLVAGLPWQLTDEFADQLAKVTPEEVSAVAAKYLIAERRTTAFVLPADAPAEKKEK